MSIDNQLPDVHTEGNEELIEGVCVRVGRGATLAFGWVAQSGTGADATALAVRRVARACSPVRRVPGNGAQRWAVLVFQLGKNRKTGRFLSRLCLQLSRCSLLPSISTESAKTEPTRALQ